MNAPDSAAVWLEVERWIAHAQIDHRAAAVCLAADPPLLDVAAFHCQQAAEKLLKGFLVSAGRIVRKTHDLAELGASVATAYPAVTDLIENIDVWTVWNIAYRYPSEDFSEAVPSPEELTEALVVVSRLVEALRSQRPDGAGCP
ncbi:MAG: HEPN domain-containing protein [Alphaproteobacteria bacterium]|nr:HEPN domain-containing protein [Alphaproteobacteria bacterium]